MRVYQIPEASKNSAGRVIQNLLSLPKEDKIKAYINIKDLKDEDFLKSHNVIFCTKKGLVKKTSMEQYSRPRSNGIQAISINEGDQLLDVRLTDGKSEILIANKSGKLIRFPEEKVRSMGRVAAGVRGIKLAEGEDDAVVGMAVVDPNDPSTTILVVSEKGNGKRSELESYRITNRGGKGVKTINVTNKTGALVALKDVREDDDLMITNKSGIIIRVSVKDLRVMGRATQGVKLIRLDEGDEIADVGVVRDGGKDTSDNYQDKNDSEDKVEDTVSGEEE